MHRECPRDYMHPVRRVGKLTLLKYPDQQPDGEIHIVSEVPDTVARPHGIEDMELVVTANEMVSEGTGDTLLHPGSG